MPYVFLSLLFWSIYQTRLLFWFFFRDFTSLGFSPKNIIFLHRYSLYLFGQPSIFVCLAIWQMISTTVSFACLCFCVFKVPRLPARAFCRTVAKPSRGPPDRPPLSQIGFFALCVSLCKQSIQNACVISFYFFSRLFGRQSGWCGNTRAFSRSIVSIHISTKTSKIRFNFSDAI